ncbi:Pol polyprotein [Elysia marginata]|uniref:Pol polyprotein n=1 Tax=Elysia marginata TaxID=1093978 RepID=A0AAV4GT74_9GAST|nr:Pol polyprotein [Elysia marginata]
MYADINRFVRSCDVCQRITNKLPRVPIQSTDIIDRPFDKVAIDIVGPMQMSRSRNRYILTMVDAATRWCEAIALKEIKTQDVANALFQIFSRLGLPQEILSDNGKQLVSNAMAEVMAMLNIDRRLSTPYHAQSNGLVERFNGTLKLMLRRLTEENPETWDDMLPAVLFAYREVPNQTTGFAPFELMYGRQKRGLSDLIADKWLGRDDRSREFLFVSDYAKKLKSTIQESCRIAAVNTEENLNRYREAKNGNTVARSFQKDKDVLVLLPRDGNNLFMRYQGPYKILQVTDLTKGYWQIPIREDCRHLTAFQTPRGLYQFVFMPFGLSTASSTFQRMMQRVLGKADFIASYFDDVMIFSKTWDDHVVHIRKTLELLENAGLTAKPAKACMGFTEVDFLGHTVV